MSTDTKTRPPVWIRKFQAWVRQQELDNGKVPIIHTREFVQTRVTPWADEVKEFDQSHIVWFYYEPETMMLRVMIMARKLSDTEIAYVDGNDGKVEYTRELWPEQFMNEYDLMELPPDIKRFLKERTRFMR